MKFEKVNIALDVSVPLADLADMVFESGISDKHIVEFVKQLFTWDNYDESSAMQELYRFFKNAKKEAK